MMNIEQNHPSSLVGLTRTYIESGKGTEKFQEHIEKPEDVSFHKWLISNEEKAEDVYSDAIHAACSRAVLPQEKSDNNDVYSDDLMLRVQNECVTHLKVIKALLSSLRKSTTDKTENNGDREKLDNLCGNVLKKCAASVVVLCAFHHQTKPWSNKLAVSEARALLDLLIEMCGSDSLQVLLCGTEDCHSTYLFPNGVSKQVFSSLQKRLNRDNWKRDPASRHAFKWCLRQVKHPFLGSLLDMVLPAALLFVDDYQTSNKSVGLQCLLHIIDNVDPTELRWNGRIEVIYAAIHPMLYQRDAEILNQLIPCLLKILAITEREIGQQTNFPRKLTRYDSVFQVILTNMDSEQTISLHQVYASSIEDFIKVLGISVLRHTKRLMHVITSYMELSDGKEDLSRRYILRALKAFILSAWPRVPNHCAVLMKSLLRLLYDVSVSDSFNITSEAKNELSQQVLDCIHLLYKCCGDPVYEVVEEVLKSQFRNEMMRSSLRALVNEKEVTSEKEKR